jgi:PHD/YefM family antitoxin component YafN of YafNO toxin-antitoxin module
MAEPNLLANVLTSA